MGAGYIRSILVGVVIWLSSPDIVKSVVGYACNWGRVSANPLPANITVQLMKDNKFDKAKLFDVDDDALKALANSGIQVMVGIPNDGLAPLVNNTKAAADWVAQNVSAYINTGVHIRYVAVSNEAFLKDYKDKYIHQVLPVCKNIYPFLSLYYDSKFPKEYAFFNDTSNSLYDGDFTYTNAFDGNLDTLASALEKNGLGSMRIIVGEVGWPTDGDANANNANAQRFYQGLFDRINQKKGTPKRPNDMPDVYVFGLLDEDAKSTLPGNFEPHWGIFNYDGSIKYQVDMGNGSKLVAAKGVKYMKKQWCVLSPDADIYDPKMKENWNIACGASTGCTSVGNGSHCEGLDNRTKASYAFNAFYQVTNQNEDGCKFNGMTIITDKDPSPANGTCKFNIALDTPSSAPSPAPGSSGSRKSGPGGGGSGKSMAVKAKPANSIIMMIGGLMLIIFSSM